MAVAKQAQFAIGQVVHFQVKKTERSLSKKQLKEINEEPWEVVRYHQIGVPPHWEVMFRSQWTGEHKSIPINELEKYV